MDEMNNGQGAQSIGNYKGVMLCNRPNEFGQQRAPDSNGPQPFKSRVDPKTQNPTGWNPTQKIFPKSGKKKSMLSGVLQRHKNFIKNLEVQKAIELEQQLIQKEQEEQQFMKFRSQAENQRQKVKILKETQQLIQQQQPTDNQVLQQQIQQNLEQEQSQQQQNEKVQDLDTKSVQSKKSSQKPKKQKKPTPAWAKTEKQQEEEKEKEIDELLEFAYDLDYDKYMEDLEIRQAFEIIKERVQDIKQDADWKQNLADQWNQAAEEDKNKDTGSVYSYKSFKSNKSKVSSYSLKEQVKAEKAKAEQEKAEWDRSTVASEKVKQSFEDRVATKIASEVLKDNQKLRGVHSKESMKKILVQEAKRQLLQEIGSEYKQPIMSKVVERSRINKEDPSNLPYLHKCPAV